MAEEPLVWVGCSVHGGRLDSFRPKAAQNHTMLLGEVVLYLQLHAKAFEPGDHSLEPLSREEAMFPSSMNVLGGEVT